MSTTLRSSSKLRKDMRRRSCSGQERPALLNDQMAQWAELHKMFGAAMKDVIVRLWPAEPIPSSYFGLVRQLIDAVP